METISEPTKVKAQKDHKCDYCRGVIQRGSIYLKSVHKDDYVYTWKSHKTCQAIVEKLDMFKDACDGVSDEDFRENILQEYDNLMRDSDISPPFQEKLTYVLQYHEIIGKESNAKTLLIEANSVEEKAIEAAMWKLWKRENSGLSFSEWLVSPKK